MSLSISGDVSCDFVTLFLAEYIDRHKLLREGFNAWWVEKRL